MPPDRNANGQRHVAVDENLLELADEHGLATSQSPRAFLPKNLQLPSPSAAAADGRDRDRPSVTLARGESKLQKMSNSRTLRRGTSYGSNGSEVARGRRASVSTLAENVMKKLPDANAIIRQSLSDFDIFGAEGSCHPQASDYGIRMQYVNHEKLKHLMGGVLRSFVTGQTGIADAGQCVEKEMDFSVVDLFKRTGVAGTPKELARDAYLMKPVPLNYRTWMYHAFHNAGYIVDVTEALRMVGDGDGLVTHVLGMSCIDVNVIAGRWSSVIPLAVSAMGLSLTGDILQVCINLLILAVVGAVAKLMNTPDLYRYTRFSTLPLRFGFFVYIVMSVATSNLGMILGYFIAIVACLVDFLMGDGGIFNGIKFECHYEVLRVLPTSRIFMCRRSGAASMAHSRHFKVEEGITGMGAWESDMAMIADINGLLVELIPMTLDDWKQIEDKYRQERMPIQALSIGMYNDKCRNIMELETALNNGTLQAGHPIPHEQPQTLAIEDV
mmetsp:Transcript_57526/g.106254  ORF Transcript_57526/g.106254 Transcript_57526/m.106254 type:complete len:498 (-) Transcript_57526:60-1553(-)